MRQDAIAGLIFAANGTMSALPRRSLAHLRDVRSNAYAPGHTAMHPSPTAQQAAPIALAAEKPPEPQVAPLAAAVEKMIVWVGSITSLVLHSLVFVAFFVVAALHMVGWDTMFLVLTTVVSLEAIYLS